MTTYQPPAVERAQSDGTFYTDPYYRLEPRFRTGVELGELDEAPLERGADDVDLETAGADRLTVLDVDDVGVWAMSDLRTGADSLPVPLIRNVFRLFLSLATASVECMTCLSGVYLGDSIREGIPRLRSLFCHVGERQSLGS